ncbi:MAG TPA: penicillin-binding transpeptidase domain-containing protein [Solirubrobacteraceae bacterium]|nr:penicillin-binding transpeptidase domain-containing protein [Solirubrobacteraceae bacterium]
MSTSTRPARRSSAGSGSPARRVRRRARLAPLAAAAVVAFVAGAAVGRGDDPRRATAHAFAQAWERGDYAVMRTLLTPEARRRVSLERFAGAYRRAAREATLSGLTTGRPGEPQDGAVAVPVELRTRIFGTLSGRVALPVVELDDGAAIDWRPYLVHPGLRRGERLSRSTALPPRAAIQARDGTPLAEGEARLSKLGALASEIAGRVGPAPPDRAAELARRGVPPGAPVGISGLEREFDAELAGRPGGELRAGDRVLASVAARPGSTVRTTIDPEIQRAAVEALAGRFGGVAVIRPSDGEVLALAGVAYSAPQPPGSVFKIVTLTAALEAGVAKPRSKYPVQTSATLEGVELENAHGEACGGSLKTAFAHSCNSVFAPMGAKLGAERLVAAAERFGFNKDPGLAGALRSTIPAAAEIGDGLAVGSTAIGQGQVLATPLAIAGVAGAIAMDGVLVRPTLRKGAAPERTRVTSPRVARAIDRYMRAVVTSGTGVGAAIPGVKVAGKTGTAELRDTTNDDPDPADPNAPQADDRTDTDAWFAAYAPARRPRVALSVLLVGQGAGGETAAPAAKVVLEAALRR